MVPSDFSKSICLIDASAFVFRAYYALQPLSSKGRPSHAVSGFASMLLKLLREKKPAGCVVVFDSKKPSFRKEIYQEYKANREVPPPDLSDQIVAVMEMCKAAHLPILQEEGIEADDWIASFVRHFSKKYSIVIVSSDKDLTQLVTDDVVMYDSFREKMFGPKEVEEKWAVMPSQMGDFLSLTGDSSDNIPGVSGVGPKTASQWLKDYQGIDQMLKLLEKKDGLPEKIRNKIEPNLEQLKLSRRLVALKSDLKPEFEKVPPVPLPFPDSFKNFLIDWDCTRLMKQFSEEFASGGEETSSASTASPEAGSQPSSASLKLARSPKDLENLAAAIQQAKRVAFDCETDSFDRLVAKPVGVSIACALDEAWYIPLRHADAELSAKDALDFLKKIFKDPSVHKIAHNLKYDLQALARDNLAVAEPLEDTMILGHLLHADRRSFSLENLSRDFLREEKGDLTALLQGSENFSTVPLEQAVQYAAQDAHLTFALFELFSPLLKENKKAEWLYREIELPLVRVLAQMEHAGILLDQAQLKKLSETFHKKIDELQKKIFELAGQEFNIQSPKQLQQILFEKLKLTPTKKTKTGFSTDESVLVELAEAHPLPKYLLEHRSLSKLTSTYVDVLPTLVGSDGRLHTHYHQTGTATGRLSSSEPNLQNIPVRSEEGLRIREAFIPAEGCELMSADYSQVELRLFAHMSNDINLINAFQGGRDIHAETAKIIFGSADKEFRERAKAINFGIIYGISAFGLAKQLDISRSDAAKFMESYFASFPRIKTFMAELLAEAKKLGYTETLFGRRRPLPDIQSKNVMLRQMAERIAVNAPIQGTAADMMKSAMVRVAAALQKEGLKSRVLLQVHDELLLEVSVSEKQAVEKVVVAEMMDFSSTPIGKLSVPMVVDCGFGKNWAEI